MSQTKRIMINVPDSLLQEVDALTKCKKSSRSNIINSAVRFYLKKQRKAEIREQMKTGYREMADINLKLAEIYFPEESSDSDCIIGSVAESDKSWL